MMQAQAAELFSVTQPSVTQPRTSDLAHGKINLICLASLSRSLKPNSWYTAFLAFARAISRTISASKFSWLAQALSPITVKPFRN